MNRQIKHFYLISCKSRSVFILIFIFKKSGHEDIEQNKIFSWANRNFFQSLKRWQHDYILNQKIFFNLRDISKKKIFFFNQKVQISTVTFFSNFSICCICYRKKKKTLAGSAHLTGSIILLDRNRSIYLRFMVRTSWVYF